MLALMIIAFFTTIYCIVMLNFTGSLSNNTIINVRQPAIENVTNNLAEKPNIFEEKKNETGSDHISLNSKYETCLMTRVKLLSSHFSCRMVEWVEYHMLMGIDHIYIVDDCSDRVAHLKRKLSHYTSNHQVTLMDSSNGNKSFCENHIPNEDAISNFVFQNFAKKDCEWIGNIDMDEYITIRGFQGGDPKDAFLGVLRSRVHPYVRLPWWKMGSDGHVTIPPGFITDSYRNGEIWFDVKTIAKSSVLNEWSCSHHPTLLPPTRDIRLNNTKISMGEYVESSTIWDDEYLMVEVNNKTVRLPKHSLYVKHYVYLSWPEYEMQRAQYVVTSSGDTSPWGGDSKREKWNGGNFTSELALSSKFSGIMKRNMALKFTALLTQFPHFRHSIDDCLAQWQLK